MGSEGDRVDGQRAIRPRADSGRRPGARPEQRPPAPVFLVGSERSGTTLLRLMLDHHPQIAFEKEFDFVVSLVSDAGDVPSTSSYADWAATVRGMSYHVDRSLTYRQLVDDFLRQKWDASGHKPYLGATVHRNFDRLRFLWPTARYIHLVRDPRDVARSVVQKGWAGNVYHGVQYWLDAEQCWNVLVRTLEPGQAIDVHYEDLVRRPVDVLSSICEFIGVTYSDRMLTYPHDAPQYPPPDPSLAAMWRTALSPRDVALVEERLGALLAARGYDLSGYPRARLPRVRHEALLVSGRVQHLRSRVELYGAPLVASDILGRRLHLSPLEAVARRRMNAVEQRLIDEETTGVRAPSANIRRSAPSEKHGVP
jgi:hypothetical protein